MKKFLAMLFVMTTLLSAAALADEVLLPDPGAFFGFDADGDYSDGVRPAGDFPREVYDSYIDLLVDGYGLEITDYDDDGKNVFCWLCKPGVDEFRYLVMWAGGEMMHFYHEGGDVCMVQPDAGGTVQTDLFWDDGRMIADPGDFLGYEIELLQIAEGDNDYGGFMRYVYEAIPMDDIVTLVEAFRSSPYFKYSGGSGGVGDPFFWLARHDYVGPDVELTAICESGRTEQYGRKSDLSIYVYDPSHSESRFAIHLYPGFSIDSEAPAPSAPEPGNEGKERCVFCNNGSCKTCGGSGYVYQWMPGEDEQRRVNCTSCINGRCTFCDGDGWN